MDGEMLCKLRRVQLVRMQDTDSPFPERREPRSIDGLAGRPGAHPRFEAALLQCLPPSPHGRPFCVFPCLLPPVSFKGTVVGFRAHPKSAMISSPKILNYIGEDPISQ